MAIDKLVNLFVNNRAVQVAAGSTLLQAIKVAGSRLPVLCHHPIFKPRAVCRMCLVDVGGDKPLPACYTEVKEGMQIATDTPELEHFRKGELEFLLARHPNECMRCEVNGQCKLQDMVQQMQVKPRWEANVRGSPSHPEHSLVDSSSPAISRDISKCVECGLCVDACGPQGQNLHVIGFAERGFGQLPVTVFDTPLSDSGCISCGQCTLRCPVGALTERNDWHRVLDVLDAGRRTTVVQTAPATRIALSEEFGFEPGAASTGRMVSALRALGFDYVFDTNFSADLTIMEEGTEFISRVQKGDAPLPMFTSCCPGWVNWLEINRPDLLPHLSTAKSPQQMHASVTKRGPFADYLKKAGKGDEDPFVVSIMPCTAKKDEAVRPGMRGDVDAVLTTRELARLIRARKIPFAALPNDAEYDHPLGEGTGAAVIFGASGGVMEAALRTATTILGVKDAPLDWHGCRGIEPGVKVAEVPGLGTVAIANTIAAAAEMFKDPTEAWRKHLFIEVMACRGGCLGGGGEPKSDDPDILTKRMKGIYKVDADAPKRYSHDNDEVKELYKSWVGEPNSHIAHEHLHTTYYPRNSPREALARFLDAVDNNDAETASALMAPDGVWSTQDPSLGDAAGPQGVRSAVEAKLAANGRGFSRHKFAGAEGLEVHTPDGGCVRYDIELAKSADNRFGIIKSITHTKVEGAAAHH